MGDLDAALAYTAEKGWHLIPSKKLERRYTKAPKPQWRLSVDKTAQLMQEQGYTPEHIERTISKITRLVEESDA